MYADDICDLNLDFASQAEAMETFNSVPFIREMAARFGKNLPFLFIFKIEGEQQYNSPNITKQGIPMDWVYFAELEPITEAAINAEQNIEKRRLLIMEYGVYKYLKKIKYLSKDSYGELIQAQFEGESQKFVKVRNGTKEPEESAKYLKEKEMLTDDGHKIYYIPVGEHITTAKEGIEDSWGLPKGLLSDAGWDYES